jgi:heat shock protein HslJ
MRGARLVVGLLVLLPVVAACGSSDSSGPAPSTVVVAKGGPGLVATWNLTGAALDSADLSTFKITLTFTDTMASGFAGVNQYTTTFTSSPEGALDFGPIASTKMAGSDEAMKAEQSYLAMLDTVTGYTVTGGELDLFAGPQEILTYAK